VTGSKATADVVLCILSGQKLGSQERNNHMARATGCIEISAFARRGQPAPGTLSIVWSLKEISTMTMKHELYNELVGLGMEQW